MITALSRGDVAATFLNRGIVVGETTDRLHEACLRCVCDLHGWSVFFLRVAIRGIGIKLAPIGATRGLKLLAIWALQRRNLAVIGLTYPCNKIFANY